MNVNAPVYRVRRVAQAPQQRAESRRFCGSRQTPWCRSGHLLSPVPSILFRVLDFGWKSAASARAPVRFVSVEVVFESRVAPSPPFTQLLSTDSARKKRIKSLERNDRNAGNRSSKAFHQRPRPGAVLAFSGTRRWPSHTSPPRRAHPGTE